MRVRDFLNRLIARFTGRASRLRSPQSVLHPVASRSAAGRDSGATERHALANWLEDGRRLRVRLTSAFAAPQEELRRPDVRAQNTERPRVISGPNRRAADAGPSGPLPQTAPLTPPSLVPSQAGPTSFADASLEEIEAMDASERKLVFLGYLIRQGIYNEGFSVRELPEQYWRSRGREPDAPAPGEDPSPQ
jgi:hypothetical protein